MDVADKIKTGIQDIPELILIGEPTFVISFRSEEIDMYHLNDFMKTKGSRFLQSGELPSLRDDGRD